MPTPMPRLPVDSITGAVASAASRLTSAMATLAPSRINTVAISLPIPLAAPVTMATLSCNCLSVSCSRNGRCLSHVIVHDLAKTERQIGENVRSRDDLEHRQLGQRGEGMREQLASDSLVDAGLI